MSSFLLCKLNLAERPVKIPEAADKIVMVSGGIPAILDNDAIIADIDADDMTDV